MACEGCKRRKAKVKELWRRAREALRGKKEKEKVFHSFDLTTID